MAFNKQGLKNLWANPQLRFIGLFLCLSGFFYIFNTAYIGITAKGGAYIPFLDKYLNYIRWWRDFDIELSATILRWLGYTVITNDYQLKVVGLAGFKLVYTCLGYGIMGVFAAFVLAFPKPFKQKIGFLLFGLLLIQALNIARFVLISIFWTGKDFLWGIDHHNFFNTIVYAILIVTVFFWIKRSERNTQNSPINKN